MQKRFVLGFAILAVLGGGFGFAADEGLPVDRYKQERTAKRAYERFLYAKEMLEIDHEKSGIQVEQYNLIQLVQ